MEKLLKKDAKFEWNENCRESLDKLKGKMIAAPILMLARIFHLLQTTRCSTGLNGSDPEQIEDIG